MALNTPARIAVTDPAHRAPLARARSGRLHEGGPVLGLRAFGLRIAAGAACMLLCGVAAAQEQPADARDSAGSQAPVSTGRDRAAGGDRPNTPGALITTPGGALTPSPARPDESRQWTLSLTPRFEHVFDANADSGGGRLNSTRAGVALTSGYAFSNTVRGTLNIDHETTWYGFKGIDGLDPIDGDPVDEAQRLAISPGIAVAINEEWSWFARTTFALSFADDADVGESFTFGGLGGVRWRASDALSISAGITATTRLEDDGIVLPFIGVEWQIDERWKLASDGPGLNLSYSIDDAWTALAFLRFERREYRLGGSNSDIDKGVLRDRRLAIGAGINWSPDRRFDVTLSGGVLASQEIEFLNRSGTEVRDTDFDPAGFVTLVGRINF